MLRSHPLPHWGVSLTSWPRCLLFAHLLNVGLSRLFPRFSILCPFPGDLTVIIQRSLSLSVSWFVFFTDFSLDHVFVYHLSPSYSVSSTPCSQHLAEFFTHKVLSQCIKSGHLILWEIGCFVGFSKTILRDTHYYCFYFYGYDIVGCDTKELHSKTFILT